MIAHIGTRALRELGSGRCQGSFNWNSSTRAHPQCTHLVSQYSTDQPRFKVGADPLCYRTDSPIWVFLEQKNGFGANYWLIPLELLPYRITKEEKSEIVIDSKLLKK